MRGSIKKNYNKSGTSYSIIIPAGKDPVTGRYKQKWITVKGTKKDAEKKRDEINRQIDSGIAMDASKIQLGVYLEKWLLDFVKVNLSPRTYEGYDSIVHVHLIPALGKVILGQLRPEQITHYYSEKLKSKCLNKSNVISSGTVRRHAMCLHSAIQTAVTWKLLPWNPADGAEPPPENQKEMSIPAEDDINIFLNTAKQTPYYELFATALYTGMRRSELIALRWNDVDLLGCNISVTKSVHQLLDKSFVVRPPKTKKSRRSISLLPTNALILKKLKENQIAQKIVSGNTLKDDDLVFCHDDGSPLRPDTVSNAWRRLAEKLVKSNNTAGLKNSHLHQARHSMASMLLQMGVHPAIVQQRLGHASIQTTIDIYSHLIPGLQEAAAQKLDNWINRNNQNTPIPALTENNY